MQLPDDAFVASAATQSLKLDDFVSTDATAPHPTSTSFDDGARFADHELCLETSRVKGHGLVANLKYAVPLLRVRGRVWRNKSHVPASGWLLPVSVFFSETSSLALPLR